MATYTDFEGIIPDFGSAGAPVNFKASVFGLTLQSSVQLAAKDIQTILDGVWHYNIRKLTDNYGADDIMNELQSHRRATEDSKFLLKPRS